MKIEDETFAKNFFRLCDDGYKKGWHERNGGNLSYRLTTDEADRVRNEITEDNLANRTWRDVGATVSDLKNEIFMVTGSGKYMRNVLTDPENNVCLIEVNETGDQYRILWGLINGGLPTSELPSHLMNLEVCKRKDENIRVVYHCHPANIIALTYILPLDSVIFTRELFEMATECPVVFPEGLGVVKWMVPGGRDIAIATAEIMKTKNFAIWAHHGAFACGHTFDETFGLMDTVEKAAEILIKVLSVTDKKHQTIEPDGFRAIEDRFNVEIDEKYLYDKTPGARIGEK